MPKLKLTYFDFHGGRGEPARLALSMAGIPFEDDRVSPSEWERRKPNTPFGTRPSCEDDTRSFPPRDLPGRQPAGGQRQHDLIDPGQPPLAQLGRPAG